MVETKLDLMGLWREEMLVSNNKQHSEISLAVQ